MKKLHSEKTSKWAKYNWAKRKNRKENYLPVLAGLNSEMDVSDSKWWTSKLGSALARFKSIRSHCLMLFLFVLLLLRLFSSSAVVSGSVLIPVASASWLPAPSPPLRVPPVPPLGASSAVRPLARIPHVAQDAEDASRSSQLVMADVCRPSRVRGWWQARQIVLSACTGSKSIGTRGAIKYRTLSGRGS